MNWKKRKKRNRILKRHGLSSWTDYQMTLRIRSEIEYLNEKYGKSVYEWKTDAWKSIYATAISMCHSKYILKADKRRVKRELRNKRIGTGKSYWTFDKYSAFMRQQLYGE